VQLRRQHHRVALFQRPRGFDWRDVPRRRDGVGVHPERLRDVWSAELLFMVLHTLRGDVTSTTRGKLRVE